MEQNTEKRKRTMTAKGLEYEINLTTDKFMKHKRKIYSMLKSETQEHDSLDAMQVDLSLMKQCFDKLKEIGMEEQNLMRFKLDIVEIEVQIANLMRFLDEDKRSNASVRSKTSSKSKSTSIASSHASKKRVELAAKFARLKTESQYVDKLAEATCELERLKLAKEVDACKAELKAVEQIEEEEFDRRTRSPISLHLDSDKQDEDGLMHKYLEDSRHYSSSSSGFLSPLFTLTKKQILVMFILNLMRLKLSYVAQI